MITSKVHVIPREERSKIMRAAYRIVPTSIGFDLRTIHGNNTVRSERDAEALQKYAYRMGLLINAQ